MKKNVIAGILAAVMACSSAGFTAAAAQRVEISFKVGDSILNINGTDTKVETPYIAGAGTTLVPLRVITEAFGAKVNWEGETKTITLEYPDVNIVLQIGNIIAKVNDHNETLLEAPALSAGGVTMVPLRFISETFGAVVEYNNENGAITVVKETADNTQTVLGSTEMARTGDSYYKWSINTPYSMKMTDRRLDGRSTKFSSEKDESYMYIDVYTYSDDEMVSFDEEFSEKKNSLSEYTLIEAEKLTDESGNRYMHLQAKDKEDIVDLREYYGKNNTVYEITSRIEISDDTSVKNSILALADSFKLGELDNQTYDLSNVKDNMRLIKNDDYKFSLKIPAGLIQSTSSSSENKFAFFSYERKDIIGVDLQIYSKSDGVTAQTMAQSDRDAREAAMNPDFSELSPVTENGGGYRYTHNISGSSSSDSHSIDCFFEKGEYIYNLCVTYLSEANNKKAEDIIASLETEKLDFSKVGKLIRNEPDRTTTSTRKLDGYAFELPISWDKTVGSLLNSGVVSGYGDAYSDALISVAIDRDEYATNDLSKIAHEYMDYIETQKTVNIVEKISYDVINHINYAHYTYTRKDGDTRIYNTVYMGITSNRLIIFMLSQSDIYYQQKGNEAFMNVMGTFHKDN